jgi:hypothetical protein|tara:strand:+ start:575 stop:811 length:237 start_codon:yes stop_codon:yes gene_type:complete
MMPQKTRTRSSSTIPFGFKLHPENNHLLIEDEDEQVIIKDIRDMSEAQSLRVLASYVEAHTGRKLTPRGIQKVIKRKY